MVFFAFSFNTAPLEKKFYKVNQKKILTWKYRKKASFFQNARKKGKDTPVMTNCDAQNKFYCKKEKEQRLQKTN